MKNTRLEGLNMTLAVTSPISIAIDPFERPLVEITRFTMYRGLSEVFPERPLPRDFSAVPFNPALIPAYCAVSRIAFIKSPELELYPQLNTSSGCRELIEDLTDLPGFLPDASCVVFFDNEPVAGILACRIQGCIFGQVNMVAVVPKHRRRGIGRHLVTKALWTFRDRDLMHATFNVNSTNRTAIRFFRKMGFQVNSAGKY